MHVQCDQNNGTPSEAQKKMKEFIELLKNEQRKQNKNKKRLKSNNAEA